MLLSKTLIDQTVTRFPRYAKSGIEIHPIEKGGSDRKFYRIQVTDESSLILVKYGTQREENSHYVEIAQFLKSLDIRVPEIYFHDESSGLIWMEDLGELDLWSYRNEPWTLQFKHYKSALDQILLLHTKAHHAISPQHAFLQVAFDFELYCWEQNYFVENCLRRYYNIDTAFIDQQCDRNSLHEIANILSRQPRVLVHRDFQSQNIMIKNGESYLIDFQGLRPGLLQYDLASLIYDPYVPLEASQRKELLDYYLAKTIDSGITPPEDFATIFDLCAMQRLMQALGAYGYLGLVKERPQFLTHIPAALDSLKQIISRIPALENIRQLLEILP